MMLNILKKTTWKMILGLLAVAVFFAFLWIKSQKGLILFGDNNISFWKDNAYLFNPYIWTNNEYGFFYPLQALNLPIQLFFKTLTLVFNVYFVSVFYFYATIFGLAVASAYLIKNINRDAKIIDYLIVFGFSVASPLTASLILSQSDIAYSFIFIYLFLGYLFSCRNREKIIFKDVVVLSVLILFVNTYFFNTILLLGVIFLYFIFFHLQFLLKNKMKTVLALSFLGLLNLYWFITPVFMSFFSGKSPGKSVAFFSDSSAKAVLDISSAQIRYFSPFMFSNSYIPDPKHSAEFFARPYIVLAAFLITIIVFFLIFAYKKEETKQNRKIILFFSAIFLLFFALSLGTKNPFGSIFLLLWNYAPGFTMFRSIFKFQFIIHFAFVVIFIFALRKIENFRSVKVILLGLVLVLLSCYFFNPIYNRLTVPYKIPDYYFQNEFDLENKNLDNTYKIFPDRYFDSPSIYTNFEWNSNNWDSANVLRFFTKQNTAFTPSSAKKIDKGIQKQLCYKESETSRNIPEVIRTMGLLNVKNLIMQNDIKDRSSSCFEEIKELSKKSVGKLDIYTVDNRDFLPHFYVPKNVIPLERNGDDGISRIISQADYDISSAIYVKNQNTGEREILNSVSGVNDALPVLEFKKINPTKYRVKIHSANGKFPLVFSESFHESWKAYLVQSSKLKAESLDTKYQIPDTKYKVLDGNEEDQASQEELAEYVEKGWVTELGDGEERIITHRKWENEKEKLDYVEKYNIDYISKNFQGTIQNDNLPDGHIWENWFRKPFFEETHLVVNGYANSWVIDAKKLCTEEPGRCVQNADGTYELELVVEFSPQRLLYIGLGISGMTLLSGVFYLIYAFYRQKKENKYEKNLE